MQFLRILGGGGCSVRFLYFMYMTCCRLALFKTFMPCDTMLVKQDQYVKKSCTVEPRLSRLIGTAVNTPEVWIIESLDNRK